MVPAGDRNPPAIYMDWSLSSIIIIIIINNHHQIIYVPSQPSELDSFKFQYVGLHKSHALPCTLDLHWHCPVVGWQCVRFDTLGTPLRSHAHAITSNISFRI